MKLWLGLKKHRAGGYGTPLSACVRLQVNLLMSILVQGAFSMDDMMAAMEVMMGTIDSMGGRGGCGSKITDKGLKMGSKGKRDEIGERVQQGLPHGKTSPFSTCRTVSSKHFLH